MRQQEQIGGNYGEDRGKTDAVVIGLLQTMGGLGKVTKPATHEIVPKVTHISPGGVNPTFSDFIIAGRI